MILWPRTGGGGGITTAVGALRMGVEMGSFGLGFFLWLLLPVLVRWGVEGVRVAGVTGVGGCWGVCVKEEEDCVGASALNAW
jgi:hypothetical protein